MQVGWIDALRTWNAGMPSWCIPRKGTPGYDVVMRIRKGDATETPKDIMDRLERKTAGKSKKQKKKSMTISLNDVQSAEVPTTTEKKKKTYKIADVFGKVKD